MHAHYSYSSFSIFLFKEAQQLETENTKLREEMKALESERSQLQFLLDMHSPKCMIQQASPPVFHASSSVPITDSTCESIPVPPIIQSPTREVMNIHNLPMLSETVMTGAKTGATTPMKESTSPYGSSYFPPTPSTTHSRSCTEPSTPATPTSVMDAPVFPTMSFSSIPMTTVADPIFQDTPVSVSLVASLASSSTCTLTDAFAISDIADFHPVVPPTPELLDDHDDPLSESFVKQYLGVDPFFSTDFSLPTLADNLTVPDSFISCRSGPGNIQTSDEACFQELGLVKPSTERPISTESYTVHTRPLLDSQFPQGEGEKLTPLSRADDSTPETPVTLSLSALLGVSFEGMDDETIDDASIFSTSSHGAIGL